MPTIEVYDPPMCCSSGVCGPNIDGVLARFAADMEWLQSQGVEGHRYNLAQQPQAFVEAEIVRTALAEQAEECLPLTTVDGQIVCSGRYPSREELAELLGLACDADHGIHSEAVAELIAIGASAAANCDSCLRYHSKRAEELGISREDMASAVRIGLMVKRVPDQRLLGVAERQGLLTAEDEDNDWEAGSCCDAASGCCAGAEEEDESGCCG